MRNPFPVSVLLAALSAGSLGASAAPQATDPVIIATGWARVDKDGSCTFFNPATRSLDTWMKDFGVTSTLDVSKLDATPEKWLVDPYGSGWIVSGSTLYQITKSGKLGAKVNLPGEVVDLGWDTKGFVLLYRSTEPYLEKREYTKANVIWSAGRKPRNPEVGLPPSRRLVISEEGSVLVATGSSLYLQSYDGAKGNPVGDAVFTLNNAAPPNLAPGGKERGSLNWWLGKGVVFAAVPGSHIPSERKSGLLLARMDLAGSTLEFLPTGVTEDHKLLGLLDAEAILMKPGGGLVFVPIR